MDVLLDECVSSDALKCINIPGINLKHVCRIDDLGSGTSDGIIFQWAYDNHHIILTENHDDFRSLARASQGNYPGLIFVPAYDSTISMTDQWWMPFYRSGIDRAYQHFYKGEMISHIVQVDRNLNCIHKPYP